MLSNGLGLRFRVWKGDGEQVMHQHSWRGLTLLRKSRILFFDHQPARRQCTTLGKVSKVDHILSTGPAGMGDDDWGLTMEEMDSMERNAVQELAARKLASPSKPQAELLSRSVAQRPPPSPLGKRAIRVKVFVDGQGKIAVEAPYNQKLLAAYKSVSGHEWDPSRRLWLFPEPHLQDVLGAVTGVPELVVDVQAVPPLVLLPMSASHFLPSSSVHSLSPQSSPAKSQERPTSAPCTPSKDAMVYIYLTGENHVAVRSPYNQNVKEACQTVPGRIWNNEEKLWIFPKAHLEELLRALHQHGVQTKVDSSLLGESEKPSCNEASADATVKDSLAFTCVKHPIKLFLHNSGLIAVKCQPSSRVLAALKSIPKAFWSHRETLWLFPSRFLHEAEQKFAACDDIACVTDSFDPLVRRALDLQSKLSNISDCYRNIPSHLESKLLPFQREGVKFGLQHGGRILIADEMGLGKTMQGIALAACVREAWPVLVIVPSSLRIHWATMLKTWLQLRGDDITVVLSQGDSTRGGFTTMHPAKNTPLLLTGLFNIISYDMVSKLSSEHTFKVIIADESHYMKNAQAKRTNACVPLIQKSLYALLLTGTPALSRPIELFKQLEALQPSVYCNVHEYGKRYCQGSFFGVYQGSSNHEELHALLKSTIMIRRLKAEVLSELPEKVREQVYLPLDMKNAKQLRGLLNELKRLREAIQCSMDDRIEQLKREEKGLINKIYVESAVAKLPAVQDYLSTVIEGNCKFLVFAHHHSMMDGIEDHFKKKKVEYIRIDGETTPGARQNLVTRFQENENIRAAVLSIRAAGVGLTLTAASTVIFAEMSWTPGDLVQAEDRVHRIGQRSSVTIYYLHAQETIDDFIWESIHRKLENLGQVLNGREEKMQVVSPLQQRQKTLNSYLRPCSRNLSELYEREAVGPSSTMNETGSYMESEHQTKRLKLSD